jgi:hypothetical protein
MTESIFTSRAKDYTNPYRQMVYDNLEEMNKVVGKLEDNSFINDQQQALDVFKEKVAVIRQQLSQLAY